MLGGGAQSDSESVRNGRLIACGSKDPQMEASFLNSVDGGAKSDSNAV